MTDTLHLDHDRQMKARIAKWIEERRQNSKDVGFEFKKDAPQLLLDFYKQLQVWDEERCRA